MANTIEIPLKDMDEIIEIHTSRLPNFYELLDILKIERSDLHIWVNLALEYYKKNNSVAFVKLLETSRIHSSLEYKDSVKDQMRVLDMLAAYYVQMANREKNKDKRIELINKATQLYTIGDKIMMYDVDHLLGRAFLCLVNGNRNDQADTQFNFILNQSKNNIPAQLGKACIAFYKKDYRGSLAYFKEVLRSNPNCPADVRLGLAYCFLKLGNIEKACLSFERTLKLDPKCVGALVGLAIMKLNNECFSDIKFGISLLSEAYKINPIHPLVLNHLSNHFFFKKQYDKSQTLAIHALQHTENDNIKAESCFHVARSYHAENDFERAFQYYYQATKLAPIKFVLPYYGLGQMYIHGGDIKNATKCFERVLKTEPENYETMKILGSIYADSKYQQERDIAKKYLKKVTEYNPDDLEACVELAKILEQSDLKESLTAYNTAINLLRRNPNNTIPPEILNNVAALNYRLGNLDESLSQLEESLSLLKKMTITDQERYNSIAVTTSYNLARVLEAQFQFQKAEIHYKNILKEHPNYIDCYLRLGCMARDRNQIYEASDWFKEALHIDNDNSNAWSLLGNLHFYKNEWGPGQKKFERILNNSSTLNDSYALIALGNIWLKMLQNPNANKNLQKKHQDLAMHYYTKVLRYDSKNIWAANGIGCVLAYQNCINEAREIFSQVREATANFPDVWLNIAHIFIEQKQYMSGIQMYKHCIKKFYKYDNVDVLQYLGHAYYSAGKFKEAKAVFLKARRVAPQDIVIVYNVALTLQKLADQILKDEKSNLKIILQAKRELGLSQTYFEYLSIHGNHVQYDIKMARIEANCCQDLMNQADYQVKRAYQKDMEEREIRQKQEKERELLRIKQNEDKANELLLKEELKKEKLKKRQEYIEKTKYTFIRASKNHKIKRKPRAKKGSNHEQEENKCPKKSKKSQADNSAKKKKTDSKCRKNISTSAKSTSNNAQSSKRKNSSNSYKKVSMTSKQKLRIVSKEIISTSEDNSSDDEVKKIIIKTL
ncbi:RNA polymerase-associated protein CTR9 homolog [Melanaphis sacchari]|uniref:RNA polymerase-associated protein CTR9 homolog n=1 Tax=Melanaphis sacchari TaxID=742174 RepID=UPI000DC135A0|nr:RNA polymerase-associated protein CTR9 homolog [Melanaphis sacchari]